MDQSCLFGPKFLEKFVGKNILRDPKIAITELIANSWDAGATEVRITWPTAENEQFFSIIDNGIGLTEDEFQHRWRTLGYDRISSQGGEIKVQDQNRTVFGKNGVGRFAGFCFGESYFVASKNKEKSFEYEVKEFDSQIPFLLEKQSSFTPLESNGTRVFTRTKSNIATSEESIRAEIGMRFLTDPSFKCYVNGLQVNFQDIPTHNLQSKEIEIDENQSLNITIIDTKDADKTTKQHGVAWHVNGRLVGEANWKSYGLDEFVDGRSSEAKSHTFIINANFLASTDSIKKDWTGFSENDDFLNARDKAYQFIKEYLLGQTEEKREHVLDQIKEDQKLELKKLTPQRREKWKKFISDVQRECNGISDKDLAKLSTLLIQLEQSNSKYSLISKLSSLNHSQLDDLHQILSEWSVDLAKEVLDELQIRLTLLQQLKVRVLDSQTKEVQELQPLFHKALWVFGPEFETIEFTSNQGMTTVIEKLFKSEEKGTQDRPDFAILPESTVGNYSYYNFDDDGNETTVKRLVIVELKRPAIKLGLDEKNQCWRYVKELKNKGLITTDTRVTCFLLGSEIDPGEADARNEANTIIQPLTYQTVIKRAESRLLKLYERVKGAPFLESMRQENLNL